MSESYNLDGGNPTYFNSLLLGSDGKTINKLAESENFDSSKMTV